MIDRLGWLKIFRCGVPTPWSMLGSTPYPGVRLAGPWSFTIDETSKNWLLDLKGVFGPMSKASAAPEGRDGLVGKCGGGSL